MAVTTSEFRRLALGLPEVIESQHMGHPDFRVGGKIFATLAYPDENFGMVKLSPEHQDDVLRRLPKAFSPAKGAWGKQGATMVSLKVVSKADLLNAMKVAWRRTAPKS